MISWLSGQDLNPLVQNGPIGNANVEWTLTEANQLEDPSLWFVSPGKPGDGQLKIQDLTDGNGEVNSLAVQTTPQKVDLPPNSVSFQRRPILTAAVDPKGSTLPDALALVSSTVFSSAVGDLKGMLGGLFSDMIQRQSFLTTRSFPIQVKDWTVPLYEGTFNLIMQGDASNSDSDGNKYTWKVNHQANGKLVYGIAAASRNQELMKEGQGPYVMHLDSLHNADIEDLFTYDGKDTQGCAAQDKMQHVKITVHGPVAKVGYSLDGGSISFAGTHSGGTDKLKIVGQTDFNLPCIVTYTASDTHGEQPAVQFASMSATFEDTVPRIKSDKISNTTAVDVPFQFGTAKGVLHFVISYELHPVKNQ